MTRPVDLAAGLDFAHPQRDIRHAPPRTGWALLAGAAVLATWLVHDHRQLADQRDAAQSALNRIRVQHERTSSATPPTVLQASEVRFATTALATGALAWEAVLLDIEAATTPEVALLELKLQGNTGEIRLMGEARTFTALAAYLARLADRPEIAGTQLLGHRLATHDTHSAGPAVKFEALLRWRAP